MSKSAALAPHIPYLRRFGRALAGSQAGGDAYALSALQALVEQPDLLRDDLDLRVSLYRVLIKIWASVPVNEATSQRISGNDAVDARLVDLTPRPRVAFLLMALEGFSDAHIAAVLECSPAEIGPLLETAQREISEHLPTDVLIIEDEPIIAMDLETLVESQGHHVIGIAATHAETIEIVHRTRPGLILADIQLADGSSGLQAVNEILQSFDVPVIFITAYPEYLLTGERPEPTFLLTKPFRNDALKMLMSQALLFGGKSKPACGETAKH